MLFLLVSRCSKVVSRNQNMKFFVLPWNEMLLIRDWPIWTLLKFSKCLIIFKIGLKPEFLNIKSHLVMQQTHLKCTLYSYENANPIGDVVMTCFCMEFADTNSRVLKTKSCVYRFVNFKNAVNWKCCYLFLWSFQTWSFQACFECSK